MQRMRMKPFVARLIERAQSTVTRSMIDPCERAFQY
jgi:hypothetical protein